MLLAHSPAQIFPHFKAHATSSITIALNYPFTPSPTHSRTQHYQSVSQSASQLVSQSELCYHCLRLSTSCAVIVKREPRHLRYGVNVPIRTQNRTLMITHR